MARGGVGSPVLALVQRLNLGGDLRLPSRALLPRIDDLCLELDGLLFRLRRRPHAVRSGQSKLAKRVGEAGNTRRAAQRSCCCLSMFTAYSAPCWKAACSCPSSSARDAVTTSCEALDDSPARCSSAGVIRTLNPPGAGGAASCDFELEPPIVRARLRLLSRRRPRSATDACLDSFFSICTLPRGEIGQLGGCGRSVDIA